MTDAPETAAPQITAPAPAPVRARALAGLIDLVPADAAALAALGGLPAAGLLIGLLLVVAVFTLLESRGGQTPGKRLMGLEVRYLDGSPAMCARRSSHRFRFLDGSRIYLIGGFAIAGNPGDSGWRSGRRHVGVPPRRLF